jgi:biopolymer transport protein ExbD
MAFKPSLRRSGQSLELELDIKPVMNLMVVLIPLLLAGVEMVKLSIIEIDLPPSKAGGGGESSEENPEKEKEKRLGLKIAITREGFSLATAGAIMTGESGEGPTVPVLGNNEFDFETLKSKLIELKKLILEKGYVDKDTAVITAGADIEYQIIINVMDTILKYEDDEGNIQPLFPQINFGQVIV